MPAAARVAGRCVRPVRQGTGGRRYAAYGLLSLLRVWRVGLAAQLCRWDVLSR